MRCMVEGARPHTARPRLLPIPDGEGDRAAVEGKALACSRPVRAGMTGEQGKFCS